METQPWLTITGQVLAALSVAVALITAAPRDDAPKTSQPRSDVVRASAPDADELMLSNRGPMVILNNHLLSGDPERLKFRTDMCGLLVSTDNTRSMIRRSALAEDMDEEDDDAALEGQAMVSRWLSVHPGIAVINEGIDKWCGELSFMDEDLEGDTSAIT